MKLSKKQRIAIRRFRIEKRKKLKTSTSDVKTANVSINQPDQVARTPQSNVTRR